MKKVLTIDLGLPFTLLILTFSFAAWELAAPNKVKYVYKFEEFNHDWIEASSQREVHDTNSNPGHNTSLVKAANARGYWTDPAILTAIPMPPPFWQTGWFIGSLLLTSFSTLYAAHRFKVEHSLKVERLRDKIASDLHDEVGSSLARISIYSDLLQKGIEAQERTNYLIRIGELSREVVSTMSDIVWSIDNHNDTLGALILRMKDFATEVLQARNIDFKFAIRKVDENKPLDPGLKQNIYLIFKESIHNIVKHANARHVYISLINESGTFSMIIKDDGCGLPSNRKHHGNGLRNIQLRAETIQAEFEIQNQDGTTLVLTRREL